MIIRTQSFIAHQFIELQGHRLTLAILEQLYLLTRSIAVGMM